MRDRLDDGAKLRDGSLSWTRFRSDRPSLINYVSVSSLIRTNWFDSRRRSLRANLHRGGVGAFGHLVAALRTEMTYGDELRAATARPVSPWPVPDYSEWAHNHVTTRSGTPLPRRGSAMLRRAEPVGVISVDFLQIVDKLTDMVRALPLLQIVISAGAAAVYAWDGDWRRFLYWSAAVVITASVTF